MAIIEKEVDDEKERKVNANRRYSWHKRKGQRRFLNLLRMKLISWLLGMRQVLPVATIYLFGEYVPLNWCHQTKQQQELIPLLTSLEIRSLYELRTCCPASFLMKTVELRFDTDWRMWRLASWSIRAYSIRWLNSVILLFWLLTLTVKSIEESIITWSSVDRQILFPCFVTYYKYFYIVFNNWQMLLAALNRRQHILLLHWSSIRYQIRDCIDKAHSFQLFFSSSDFQGFSFVDYASIRKSKRVKNESSILFFTLSTRWFCTALNDWLCETFRSTDDFIFNQLFLSMFDLCPWMKMSPGPDHFFFYHVS